MPYKDKAFKTEYDRIRREANIELARAYKLEKGCADCGYNEHHAGLEFDHVRGKYQNVASMTTGTAERMFNEIAKCDVVCGVCHNIRTFERRMAASAADLTV